MMKRALFLICLLTTLAAPALSQWNDVLCGEPTIFHLKISDELGGYDSLTFGNVQNATFGVDAALGENSSPPPPPGFSAVFVAPRTPNDWGLGLMKKDLRPLRACTSWYRVGTAVDSFYVKINNGGTDDATYASNVYLSWPDSEYLLQRCDSIIMTIPGDSLDFPGTRLNMMRQSSLVVTRPYDPNGWNWAGNSFKVKMFVYTPDFTAGVDENVGSLPESFGLKQNYPNPFNPSTTFEYQVKNRTHVRLSIYNMMGQLVSVLVDKEELPGYKSIDWQSGTLPSGVYFYRLQAGKYSETKKLIMTR